MWLLTKASLIATDSSSCHGMYIGMNVFKHLIVVAFGLVCFGWFLGGHQRVRCISKLDSRLV